MPTNRGAWNTAMDNKKVAIPADAATDTAQVKPSRRRWPWLAGLLLTGIGAAMAARAMRRSRTRTTDLTEDDYLADHPVDYFDTNGVTPAQRRQPANDQLHPASRN